MNVWCTGMRLWWRARSRTCASEGAGPVALISALATAIKDPLRVSQGEVARAQQDGEVIQEVGALLGHALVGFLAGGAHDLLGLLLHLGTGQRRVIQEGDRVGAVWPTARTIVDRALEHAQDLAGRLGLELAAVKAGALAGVA